MLGTRDHEVTQTCPAQAPGITQSKENVKMDHNIQETRKDSQERNLSSECIKSSSKDENASASVAVPNDLQRRICELSDEGRKRLLLHLVRLPVDTDSTQSGKLANKADEILPPFSYSRVLALVTTDSGSSEDQGEVDGKMENTTVESAEILLLCLSDGDEQTMYEWYRFFLLLEISLQVAIVRKFLRMGSDRLKTVLADAVITSPFFRGLEVALCCEVCAKAFAALLRDEVLQSKDKPGNFFQTTELGMLLSYHLLPNINEKTYELEHDHDTLQVFTRQQARSKGTASDEDYRLALSGKMRIQAILKTLFRHLLHSNDDDMRKSALLWAISVLNKNSARSVMADPERALSHGVCGDAYMLNFCSLVLEGCEPLDKLSSSVDLCYYSSPACRLALTQNSSLLKGKIRRRQDCKKTHHQFENHVTECYHVCQQAISQSVLPVLRFHNRRGRIYDTKTSSLLSEEAKKDGEKYNHLLQLFAKAVCKTDIRTAVNAFYMTQSKLLQNLLDETKNDKSEAAFRRQMETLSQIPEVYVTDMVEWFVNLNELGIGSPLTPSFPPFVDLCVTLLRRKDLDMHPLMYFSLLKVIITFARDAKYKSVIRQKMSQIRKSLCEISFKIYIGSSVLESLQVDRGIFKSYPARGDIGELFQLLWDHRECQRFFLVQSSTSMFRQFISSLLETLIFFLSTTLSSSTDAGILRNLLQSGSCKMQAPVEQWQTATALDDCANQAKTRWRNVERTLKTLCSLAGQHTIAACLARSPLSSKVASTVWWVNDHLYGREAHLSYEWLSTKKGFSLWKFLERFTDFILDVASQDPRNEDGFINSLARNPVLNLDNMRYSRNVVEAVLNGIADKMKRLDLLIEELENLYAEKHKQERNTECLMKNLPSPESEDFLLSTYPDKMRKFQFTSTRLLQSHSYQALLDQINPNSDKMAVLKKEFVELRESLLVHSKKAIFVACDEERWDCLRCVMSGPVGTPYSRGLFAFDIYCQEDYPDSPPLVALCGTNQDSVFQSSAHAVDTYIRRCLLESEGQLGGSHKKETRRLSLRECLLSLRSSIFAPDSILGSSSVDVDLKSTTCGKSNLQKQWNTQAFTIYNAMVLPLRNPPEGMENVVCSHFALQRNAVLRQCADWIVQCGNKKTCEILRGYAEELVRQFQGMDRPLSSEQTYKGEGGVGGE